MDIGTVRGILTAILLVLFIGIVIWSYSRRRRDDFDEAARLPLDDDGQSPDENDNDEERKT